MLSESFDGICAYAVHEHIPPEFRTDWLQEVHRLLRPGGALLIARCPRPESRTEQLDRCLGIPAQEYLISTDSLVVHVESVGFAVEGVWLNDHIPSFLPWGPRWFSKANWMPRMGRLTWSRSLLDGLPGHDGHITLI